MQIGHLEVYKWLKYAVVADINYFKQAKKA